MGLPSLVMWEPTERSVDDVVQTAHADDLVAVDRNVGAEVPVYLAGQQARVELDVETAVADLGAAHVGRRRGRA